METEEVRQQTIADIEQPKGKGMPTGEACRQLGDGLTPVELPDVKGSSSRKTYNHDNTNKCHNENNPYKTQCKRCQTKFINDEDASLSSRGLCWWCEDQLQESPLELPITREELIAQWYATLEQARNTAQLAKGHLQILINHQDIENFGIDLEKI